MGSQMDILLVGVVIVGVLYMNGSFKGLLSSKSGSKGGFMGQYGGLLLVAGAALLFMCMRKPKDIIEGQQNNEDNSSMDELPECEMDQLTAAFAARGKNPELGGPLEASCNVWVGDGSDNECTGTWTEISSANQFLEVNGFDVNISEPHASRILSLANNGMRACMNKPSTSDEEESNLDSQPSEPQGQGMPQGQRMPQEKPGSANGNGSANGGSR